MFGTSHVFAPGHDLRTRASSTSFSKDSSDSKSSGPEPIRISPFFTDLPLRSSKRATAATSNGSHASPHTPSVACATIPPLRSTEAAIRKWNDSLGPGPERSSGLLTALLREPRILFSDLRGIRFAIRLYPRRKRRVVQRENLTCKIRCVLRAGFADRNRRDRNAARHLNGRQQRIESNERARIDRDTDDGLDRVSCDGARQVSCHAGAADEHLTAARFGVSNVFGS